MPIGVSLGCLVPLRARQRLQGFLLPARLHINQLEDAAWSIRLDTNELLLFLRAGFEKLSTHLWLVIAAIELCSRLVPCHDLPVNYIIVPVLSKKPSRKRHLGGRPAEG